MRAPYCLFILYAHFAKKIKLNLQFWRSKYTSFGQIPVKRRFGHLKCFINILDGKVGGLHKRLGHFHFPLIHHPWSPAQFLPCTSRSQTSLRSLSDYLPFKLSKLFKHMEYQFFLHYNTAKTYAPSRRPFTTSIRSSSGPVPEPVI
jgi:hypothetical protein